MWEEDPSYQNSNFRLLVGSVLCALLVGPMLALWTGDWGYYQGFLVALAVVLGALCVYAAFVWTVAHLIRRIATYLRRVTHQKDLAEQGGPANGSQPFRSDTNPTSGAAGSRR